MPLVTGNTASYSVPARSAWSDNYICMTLRRLYSLGWRAEMSDTVMLIIPWDFLGCRATAADEEVDGSFYRCGVLAGDRALLFWRAAEAPSCFMASSRVSFVRRINPYIGC